MLYILQHELLPYTYYVFSNLILVVATSHKQDASHANSFAGCLPHGMPHPIFPESRSYFLGHRQVPLGCYMFLTFTFTFCWSSHRNTNHVSPTILCGLHIPFMCLAGHDFSLNLAFFFQSTFHHNSSFHPC